MIKFTFFVSTPRGGHYNSHYARTKKIAKAMVKQWNEEFKGTGYGVELTSVKEIQPKDLPEYYICW